MRLVLALSALVLALAVFHPAGAQQSGAPQDGPVCRQALANLADVRAGKSPPVGIEPDGPRLKKSGPYTAPADAAAFEVDAYREHGDVRALCPKSLWPDTVQDATLKKNLLAALKANPKAYCGDRMTEDNVPAMVLKWTGHAGEDFFADRILELQNKLDTTAGVKQQSAARHASDTQWLLAIISDVDAACPNGEAALLSGGARIAASRAADFAEENLAFVQCVAARKAWDPQMKAFDALAASTDPAPMEAAYKALETAAAPVRAACKPSEEGSKENEYLLAARKLRILFLTTPGCRDAAVAMNDIRGSINSASRSSQLTYIAQMRDAAKTAATACHDPAAQTWGEFVAWIAEKNRERLPES